MLTIFVYLFKYMKMSILNGKFKIIGGIIIILRYIKSVLIIKFININVK